MRIYGHIHVGGFSAIAERVDGMGKWYGVCVSSN